MGKKLGDADLLTPWAPIPANQTLGLESELRKELALGHALHGRVARALARREDTDDVLFEVEGGRLYAVVHLTWTGQPERDPAWPRTAYYDSLDEWEAKGMAADHQQYAVAEEDSTWQERG